MEKMHANRIVNRWGNDHTQENVQRQEIGNMGITGVAGATG